MVKDQRKVIDKGLVPILLHFGNVLKHISEIQSSVLLTTRKWKPWDNTSLKAKDTKKYENSWKVKVHQGKTTAEVAIEAKILFE